MMTLANPHQHEEQMKRVQVMNHLLYKYISQLKL